MYILPYYILVYPIIDLQCDLIEIKFGVKALLWYSKKRGKLTTMKSAIYFFSSFQQKRKTDV
jgi:hypothetical protein